MMSHSLGASQHTVLPAVSKAHPEEKPARQPLAPREGSGEISSKPGLPDLCWVPLRGPSELLNEVNPLDPAQAPGKYPRKLLDLRQILEVSLI